MKKRLRWIAIAIGTALLAILTPVDEILIIVAVSTFLYRFGRNRYERFRQARALGHSKLDRR